MLFLKECDGFCKLKGQLLGLVIIILWSIISSLIIFITIDCTCRLRVSPIEEGMGVDTGLHLNLKEAKPKISLTIQAKSKIHKISLNIDPFW